MINTCGEMCRNIIRSTTPVTHTMSVVSGGALGRASAGDPEASKFACSAASLSSSPLWSLGASCVASCAMVVGANMLLTNYVLGWGLCLGRRTLRLFAGQDGGKATGLSHARHDRHRRRMRVSR